MKKYLISLAFVVSVATLCFSQPNTVQTTKLLVQDPPIITFPPRHILGDTGIAVKVIIAAVEINLTKAV
ncbi:MAG: hypothetical protein WCK78_15910 [Paludibacter sp.]